MFPDQNIIGEVNNCDLVKYLINLSMKLNNDCRNL